MVVAVADARAAPSLGRVPQFCLPHGVDVTSQPSVEQPVIYSFVLTGGDGTRSFGTCMLFYERSLCAAGRLRCRAPHSHALTARAPRAAPTKSQAPMYLPKVLCLLSHWPFFGAFKAILRCATAAAALAHGLAH